MPFSLDPRLEGDTLPVGHLRLCELRLMNDARYPWLILVPAKPDLIELTDLSAADRQVLMEEISCVSDVLAAHTACDKVNVGAIGNVVSQLHVHVIARFRDDETWPAPVWGRGTAQPYEPEEAKRQITALKDALRQAPQPTLLEGMPKG